MIGFCLAAGAGTRLRPLTRAVPKPLLAPAGRSLLELAIEALQAAGATRVVVNAHYGADQLVARLAGRAGVEVVVEPVLLGTGGGLINAARLGLLGDGHDPVLVTAADHVVDPADLVALAAFLEESGAPMAAGLVPTTNDPFALRLEPPGPDPPPDLGTTPDLWTTRGPSAPDGIRSPTGGPGSGAGRSATPRDEPVTPWDEPAQSGGRVLRDPGGGGRVVRDPRGGWGSAGMYAVRAGLLCDLEPGYATLVDRVLGPLLAAGRLVGLPVRGAVADAGTLARLLDVSAGLLTGRWPYALPPGQLVRGTLAGAWELGLVGDGGAAAAEPPHALPEPPRALPEPPSLPPEPPHVPPGSTSVLPGSTGVLRGLVFVAVGAEVDPAAVLVGPVVLDVGCRVGAGVVVTRSVVGPGAVIGRGASVAGSFLGPGARVPSGATVAAALVPSGAPPR